MFWLVAGLVILALLVVAWVTSGRSAKGGSASERVNRADHGRWGWNDDHHAPPR